MNMKTAAELQREKEEEEAKELPTKAEADALVLKQQEEAKKNKEKAEKEAEVVRAKEEKERQEEETRRAKIQLMVDGAAGSVSASKKVDRYETEDGLPPRFIGGSLTPVNAKKSASTTTPQVLIP